MVDVAKTKLVLDYIKYYENIMTEIQCEEILECTEFVPSTYSNNEGKVENEERVRMDEFWVKNDNALWPTISSCYEEVIKRYSKDFPLFSVQRITDFRINRYDKGGFMSKHCDNIHHSHGQQYGYPQVSALLYPNDDYEGGEFFVAEHQYLPKKGSAIIFPSNFMFPHEAKKVTKGMRWSIVTWLM